MSPLLSLLVLAIVVWFIFWLVDSIPAPTPINFIVKAVVAVLAIVKALAIAGLGL
jgi:hypothetical protein